VGALGLLGHRGARQRPDLARLHERAYAEAQLGARRLLDVVGFDLPHA
jgi:hypothetical protein